MWCSQIIPSRSRHSALYSLRRSCPLCLVFCLVARSITFVFAWLFARLLDLYSPTALLSFCPLARETLAESLVMSHTTTIPFYSRFPAFRSLSRSFHLLCVAVQPVLVIVCFPSFLLSTSIVLFMSNGFCSHVVLDTSFRVHSFVFVFRYLYIHILYGYIQTPSSHDCALLTTI